MVPIPQLIFVEQFLAEVRKKALLIEEGDQSAEAALLPLPLFGGHRELEPFFGYPEPRLLIQRAVGRAACSRASSACLRNLAASSLVIKRSVPFTRAWLSSALVQPHPSMRCLAGVVQSKSPRACRPRPGSIAFLPDYDARRFWDQATRTKSET